MRVTQNLYSASLMLLTDLYQLTMAYGYWKAQKSEEEAVFNLFFRSNPFKGGYSIACGLDYVIDFLDNFKFTESDLEYLATLTGNDHKPLFERGFLDYLGQMRFQCDVEAIPEGTVVFPHEPLLKIRGPLVQCQIIETALLNIINFQTLIATKSSRVCIAAEGESVLEFGLRRAQGIDGSLSASRAAYIGGASATSNVLAGKLFGIPVRGTHAHSWIMSFDSELEAFDTYAAAMPNNCVFLVDTYNTLEGVKNAIKSGLELRKKGFEMTGVRLDSGDLAYLSSQARVLLDEAGFPEAAIVATNDLDEYLIYSLKQQAAKINVWGVGTRLVTAYEQPALGGVYKLAAIKNRKGTWDYKVKLSEQAIKVSNPGLQQVRRFYTAEGLMLSDMIFDTDNPPKEGSDTLIVDPMDMTRRKRIAVSTPYTDLLTPIFKGGKKVYDSPSPQAIRKRAMEQLQLLHPSFKRFANPHAYPVGLEQNLYELKTSLILKLRALD
ncbi:MAG: nicotinate phosphoribosyltransferase [Cytophagales bacterium]|nr:MAG: nicotinate phosphoribosyltransferase [Cytophagales bacterium]TAF59542.1 MAG: nicotinate phosphoribosyltransferase [Cytophagales bacterium]